MRTSLKAATALAERPAPLLRSVEMPHAHEHPLTAIDIALEPDATMARRAQADNSRLLKVYPDGFTLDATHHPHLTMVQQFVRTADLDAVYAASNKVLIGERVDEWKLRGFKYYYIPASPVGIAGIVVERTQALLRLQRELLDAVQPFVDSNGTPAAFMSSDGGGDIQPGLIEYVAKFETVAAGENFNPHVTIGIASEAYLDRMLAEPFAAFTFSAVGASVYQLGTFGSARKKLHALSLAS